MDTNGQVDQLLAILASEELENSLKGPRGSNTERQKFNWGTIKYSHSFSQAVRNLQGGWSSRQPRAWHPTLLFS